MQYTSEWLHVLSQAGYVAPWSDDFERYELTGAGQRYLDGEARADQIVSEPHPRRRGNAL